MMAFVNGVLNLVNPMIGHESDYDLTKTTQECLIELLHPAVQIGVSAKPLA